MGWPVVEASLDNSLPAHDGRVRKWRGVVRRACGACQTVRFHSLLIEPDM
ncbi:hypothetical protein GGQ90_003988, partial [Sphingobium scionense]|nr:hypothetical protein [Sphingobium scionense]